MQKDMDLILEELFSFAGEEDNLFRELFDKENVKGDVADGIKSVVSVNEQNKEQLKQDMLEQETSLIVNDFKRSEDVNKLFVEYLKNNISSNEKVKEILIVLEEASLYFKTKGICKTPILEIKDEIEINRLMYLARLSNEIRKKFKGTHNLLVAGLVNYKGYLTVHAKTIESDIYIANDKKIDVENKSEDVIKFEDKICHNNLSVVEDLPELDISHAQEDKCFVQDFEYLTDAELLIMKCIWNSTIKMALSDIVCSVNNAYYKDWKPQTVSTYLASLVRKEFLEMNKNGRNYTYSIKVTEKQYFKRSTEEFLAFWECTIIDVISAYLEKNEINSVELDKIKNMIELQDNLGQQ